MTVITDEIDVFADISTKQQLDTLPPVFEMPVAPAMRSYMDVDLAVTAEGAIYVFFDDKIHEHPEYAIYSIDDSILYFVSELGRIQDIGMRVQKPLRKYMRGAASITLTKINEEGIGLQSVVPLIVQNIGF
jgi:hypothetical protein